jgi:hypothetical protein
MAGRSTQLARLCNRRATLWTDPVPDGFGGATFSAGRLIKVGWKEKMKEVLVEGGTTVSSTATFLAGEEVPLGSWISPKDPDELSSTEIADPMEVEGSREVLSLESAEPLDRSRTVREYTVGRRV